MNHLQRSVFTHRSLLFAAMLGASACLLELAANSHASLLVVPGAQAATEGNGHNGFPFNVAGFGVSSMRYQQVYASSAFSALTGPSLITEITFRPDASFGVAFSSTLPDMQINLSTTAFSPDALSATFATNVGTDDTVVFARGALSLSSAFTGPGGGSKAFDIVITLTTPFLYDPANGNLLLDVRNFGGGATIQFDAQETLGDSISRAYTVDDVNATTATGDDPTNALITRFTFVATSVPEPGTALAGLVALVPSAFARRRKAN